jgi:hypothetical protein
VTPEPAIDIPFSPVYLGSPIADALVHVTVELAAELWVVKRRLQLLEKHLEDRQISLDALPIDDAEAKAGAAEAQKFADRVLRALGQLSD